MQFGLFCTYENPQQNFLSAYAEQTELVQMIEALGFNEAWVAEHHFNANAASPSSLPILSYLAARTSRLRLGSAAILLAFRDPVLVAEDVATLDILSNGRFNFGIAKGGPFPHQNKHFGLTPEEARQKTKEALSFIQKLLYEDNASFDGDFFKTKSVELFPKPIQTPIPTFVATSTPDMISMAAEQDYGLLAGPPFPLATIKDYLHLYRSIASERSPRLTLIRFYHLAKTQEQALSEARMLLKSFVDRMRETTAAMQPGWTAWMEMDRLIEDSLIGTEAAISAKLAQLQKDIGPRAVILKPVSPDYEKRRQDLHIFGEKIMTRRS
jgi:alkanesulfonate monooxygenase SsuD/methylene tetrahydromethanopterin reductase-like flavin-dependent oxidoreductase (luciferase family)